MAIPAAFPDPLAAGDVDDDDVVVARVGEVVDHELAAVRVDDRLHRRSDVEVPHDLQRRPVGGEPGDELASAGHHCGHQQFHVAVVGTGGGHELGERSLELIGGEVEADEAPEAQGEETDDESLDRDQTG